jgi:hypothetical protein
MRWLFNISQVTRKNPRRYYMTDISIERKRIPMNLQIFAGGEVPEAADPVLDEVDSVGVEEAEEPAGVEVQEPAEPVIDENARFAAARREAERKVNSMNQRVAERFGNYTNPITGKPITTLDEYFDALDAQEHLNTRQQMQEKGVDPELIDRAIKNNPLMRQAENAIREMNLQRGNQELNRQIAEISTFYPEVKTLEDITKMETFPAFDSYVKNGMGITEAFKLANFDALMQRGSAASKQAAINAAKGKSHMTPVGGASTPEGLAEIPHEELSRWREFFPNATAKELREKYNRVHKN